ncbi:putative serine protease PepD [Candidatus Planktophila sulfonica]|uniref:Putative serine protease PepD n=1 Tax=Candidatus Planktophila sulfonica TaxID=1884904 RepID=A0A249KFX7_9ACTN|nr:trypsin-like peptidase domain-containing protein [Candidatus Planktophila sulfonica]ASY15646.1 putative serine protease PepD [Candidatus Planktophila sulfonica]
MKNTKTIGAFVAGVVLAGSVATAAITPTAGTLKACADNRTQALYLSSNGTCSSSRTLVEIGGNGMNTKTISSLVTPSVVSISATTSSGEGTGSGSIYKSNSSSSYIITNNHVIEAAATTGTIKVELTNGEQYTAKIVGRDPGYDIAVLQIQIGNLPAIALGDSSKVSVGDPVLAIGSPLGLASTVTSGIISALNRPVSTGTADAQSYVNAIQTDAAINPGNSGGALIDSQGRIIGVNSAIATLSSGSASGSIGLGFSIPINEAKRVIDEIIATGKSTRPVLGVYFDPTFTGIGAKIARLSAGEGAEKAGIPVGSVIRSIDGVKVIDNDTAIVRIRSYVPGTVVSVLVDLPTGGSKTFKVTLGSAPSL